MNILIICRCLSIGGAERVASCWANGLHKSGNKIYILTDTSVPQTYYLESGIEIISVPDGLNKPLGIKKSLTNRYSYIRLIKRTIDEKSIDAIVKVMHVNAIELLIATNLSKKKPPIILTDHNAYERPESTPMSLKMKFQKFWLNALFDKVTVLTQRDKYVAQKHHLKNVETLYNPLSLEQTHQTTIERGKTVLAVGRLDSWHVKGFDILIKAWNKICIQHPDWKLRIIGSGSRESIEFLKSLSTNINQLEIKDFTRNISQEYSQAQIFVLSSRYEAWGLVLVEAMSKGCACVACDYLGRQAEIIEDNKTGILCPPEDVNSLSDSINQLIFNSQLRLELQTNCTKSVNLFSEDKVATNLLKIIKDTIK